MEYCIFNFEKKCTDFKMILTEKKIKVIPDIKINELDVGSMDGTLLTKTKISKNSIKLTFECFDSPNNVYDCIRNFITYLNPMNGEVKISFSNELDKYRKCVLSNGNDIEFFYSQYLIFGKFELEFSMFDPFTYSKNVKKFYYNGKNGAIGKLLNEGGYSCPLIMKVYPPKGVQKTKYEEDNPSITYTGEWAVYSTSYFSGGKSKHSSFTGSSASLRFTGTGIKICGLKSAGKGIANIYIDDVLVKKADCYASSEVWNAILFEKYDLSNATHTVKIEVAGEKSDSAVGYQINLDFIEITSSSIPSNVLPMEIEGETFNYQEVPSITNVKVAVNDDYIKFKSKLAPTDELVIDTKNFEMKLNFTPKLKYWEGGFPILEKGKNRIVVTDDGNLGALVIFEFVERWL